MPREICLFPIGQPGRRAVLEGHRGLPSCDSETGLFNAKGAINNARLLKQYGLTALGISDQAIGSRAFRCRRTAGRPNGELPRHVLDVSLLPMPKPQMKAALKKIWCIAAPAQRQALQVGYMSLANFQIGVGPKPISLALSDLSDDFTSKAMSQLEATMAWIKRTSDERMVLFEEFVTFKPVK